MKLSNLLEATSPAAERWFKELKKKAKEVYFVGGAVRDELLGRESKDIDLLVSGLTISEIEAILRSFGSIAIGNVGGKQVVIKFKPKNGEEIDIAIPRTETRTGVGHKGFDIKPDPNLPILKDLERRDFTINAITKDADGKLYDPFGGQEDLKRKIIRAVTPEAFADDPLRMLRAIQFAARFGFKIEPATWKLIQKNASLIKEITGERILLELEKVIAKGNPSLAAKLLKESGLANHIFSGSKYTFKPETLAELLLLLDDNPENLRRRLKISDALSKSIRALLIAFEAKGSKKDMRWAAAKALSLDKSIVRSKVTPTPFKSVLRDFTTKLPAAIGNLPVDGEDLMKLGYKGAEIGKAFQAVLDAIYDDKLKPTRTEVLKFLAH